MASIEIKSAIEAALYQGNQEAADSLTRFEATREAWTVAEQLLRDDSLNPKAQSTFRFYGAKMVYSKTQRDFDQLSPSDIPKFLESLVQHVIALSQLPQSEKKICRYICLSIAAMAIQIDQSGVIRSVLQLLNPLLTSSPDIVVLFLSLLPEECENERIQVTMGVREAFEHQLTDSFQEVMGFLESRWESSDEVNRNKILDCASNWIEFTHITPDTLMKQPIYTLMLDCLAIKDLFEHAAKAVNAAFYRFTGHKDLLTLLQASLPRILGLRSTWKSVQHQNVYGIVI